MDRRVTSPTWGPYLHVDKLYSVYQFPSLVQLYTAGQMWAVLKVLYSRNFSHGLNYAGLRQTYLHDSLP